MKDKNHQSPLARKVDKLDHVTTFDSGPDANMAANDESRSAAMQMSSAPLPADDSIHSHGDEISTRARGRVDVVITLGWYSLIIGLDTAGLPSTQDVLRPFSQHLRPLRRWRYEGLLLFAWLVHVGIIWTLRAVEAAEGPGTCAKVRV